VTTAADQQHLADIAVYRRVLAAGFPHVDQANPGAAYATAIMLDRPASDPATLWAQFSVAGDPKAMTGWRPQFFRNSPDPIWQRASIAIVATEAPALIGGSIAGAVGGTSTALGQVAQGTGLGLGAVAQKINDPFGIGAFFAKLSDPKFLLTVAYVVGGGFLFIMGAYLIVEHTGAGQAVTGVAKKVAGGPARVVVKKAAGATRPARVTGRGRRWRG
jgi:hypothetical protein